MTGDYYTDGAEESARIFLLLNQANMKKGENTKG